MDTAVCKHRFELMDCTDILLYLCWLQHGQRRVHHFFCVYVYVCVCVWDGWFCSSEKSNMNKIA